MQLYGLKVLIFLEELLSVITTPFVMMYSLSNCSEKIIDFFREFTVHVDGLGHVCSYAVFDFKRNGIMKVRDIYSPLGTSLFLIYCRWIRRLHNTPRLRIKCYHPTGGS